MGLPLPQKEIGKGDFKDTVNVLRMYYLVSDQCCGVFLAVSLKICKWPTLLRVQMLNVLSAIEVGTGFGN